MSTENRPFRDRAAAVVLAALLFAMPGCSSRLDRTLHAPEAGPPAVSPATSATTTTSYPLKGHLRDGGVVLFDAWRYDEATRVVSGAGARLDPWRKEVARGELSVPLDSVVLFETNSVHRRMSPVIIALSFVTAAVAVACLSNPKGCFGSCPTFYLDDGKEWKLVAESFSSSILPALEATDVDALPRVVAHDGRVELRMTNEAQETHVVRSVDLRCVARPAGGEAWASDRGGFVTTGPAVAPRSARGPEGDCLAALVRADGHERMSACDTTDLAATETIELEFPAAPEGELAVVLTARQSLLTTYLLYQGLAWLGSHAGAWLAGIERSGSGALAPFGGLQRALGSLRVEVDQANATPWSADCLPFETGPIAVDTRIVPLGRAAAEPGAPVRVRLTLTRGNNRLDRVALAGIRGPIEARRLRPVEVWRDGRPDAAALADLLDSSRTLVTLPGDTCRIFYRLPEDVARAPDDWVFFLEGRGYYLEWMRTSWLAEEDPRRALQLVVDPRATLRAIAGEYGRGEAAREAMFWRSRHGAAP